MDVLSRMEAAGVVPVVVLEKAEDAVPTAKAMLIAIWEMVHTSVCLLQSLWSLKTDLRAFVPRCALLLSSN